MCCGRRPHPHPMPPSIRGRCRALPAGRGILRCQISRRREMGNRNDISRTMRSRNTPMGCLRAEEKRGAHHERHTEDTGAEMGNGTRRGRPGGRRRARATTKSGLARRNPTKRFVQCFLSSAGRLHRARRGQTRLTTARRPRRFHCGSPAQRPGAHPRHDHAHARAADDNRCRVRRCHRGNRRHDQCEHQFLHGCLVSGYIALVHAWRARRVDSRA